MEHRTSTFEDHLSVIEGGQQKTASKNVAKDKNKDSLLAKLAAELGMDKEKGTPEATTEKAHEAAEKAAEKSAPIAEGQREQAGENPASASTEVSAATDGVVVPQVIVAGGDPVRAEAGMAAHVVAPVGQTPLIATGENTVTDAQNLNKTPEAVAAASRGAGGAQAGKLESAAVATPALNEEKEAEKIGQIIAKSFQTTLEKSAADQDYVAALNYLSENGLLEGFNVKDAGIAKTASYQAGGLEKLANKQPLSREDVISAAIEYADLEKQAAEAEEQGRADAHALVDFLASMEKTGTEQNAETGTDQEKIAELLKDESVVSAIKTLKAKQLL